MSEQHESTFTVGERVVWLYTPRGGYGYGCPTSGEVVSVGATRVCIRVARRSGEMVTRWVRPENLRKAAVRT